MQLGNLLRRRPMFPHPRISRDSFLHAVSLRGLGRLCTGPDFRIVISHPPRLLGARLGALVAAAVHEMEKRLTKRLCPLWVKNLGFHTSMVRARDCSTPEELVHAIFQSSAAPPVFPVTVRNGHPALDGGLVENVPLSTVTECRRPLVLLSRHVHSLPRGGRELYAYPSRPIPVSTWDFSSPDKIIETFELGRSDGERFLGHTRVRCTGPLNSDPPAPTIPVARQGSHSDSPGAMVAWSGAGANALHSHRAGVRSR